MAAVVPASAGPPLGGLYLKPPSAGGLCEGVTTMPSARASGCSSVPGQDGVRDGRGGRVALGAVDAHVDPLGRQHLEGGQEGRLGERVRVATQEQRPAGALGATVGADGGRRGEDVVLVEGCVERGAPVTRGPEGDALRGLRDVRRPGVVRRHERFEVHELIRTGGTAGIRVGCHGCSLLLRAVPEYAAGRRS